MSTEYAKIKIKIKDGKVDAKVSGTPITIIEAFAHMLCESSEMLKYFKASVEVAELHIDKQS